MENIEACDAGAQSLWEVKFGSRVCFILGGEESGIEPSILGRTQGLYIPSCAPHAGATLDTLNLSVAAALALAERRRQWK